MLSSKNIELLAPAGSPEALDAAVGEGADAVYLGLKSFNARMRSSNFTYGQFESALDRLHQRGKKIYVTVNTVFEQREADRMYQLLKYLAGTGPDAVIVQDFGVIAMARSEFPSLKLHASTQMNIASSRGANLLSRHGVSRVVLARELCLEELKSVRAGTNLELEIFVHGALCVSASGICLFSGYLGGKSANRGMCTQACRRLYHLNDGSSGYYFSPGDLQLLERLPDVVGAGINALKIEGRMKSADYVGAVVSAYRLVLDALADGNEEKTKQSFIRAQEILKGDFARSKTRFYFDSQTEPSGWLNPSQDGGTGISLGAIQKTRAGNLALVSPPDGIVPEVGDTVRLHSKDDFSRVSHKLAVAKRADGGNSAGRDIGNSPGRDGDSSGHNKGQAYWISMPEEFKQGDSVYLIQTRRTSKRYPSIIARNAASHGPGRERAPLPQMRQLPKLPQQQQPQTEQKNSLPEGLYVQAGRIEDLYIIQSSRPAAVMLDLTRKNFSRLISGDVLPFKSADIIPVLDPYFPQGLQDSGLRNSDPQNSQDALCEDIGLLIEKGYRRFVVNNPGHFSLFKNAPLPQKGKNRGAGIQLIAGPWLYVFNSWSLSFILSQGVAGIISPFENNRQNLDRTMDAPLPRSVIFVPVFAWPALFRIRADLGPVYNFSAFTDNKGDMFSLSTGLEGSMVFPQTPFSIIDKIPFLKEAGFRRFVVDLSGALLKKNMYRDLMKMITEGKPLPGASRYNWKDGFYQAKEA